MNLAHISQVVLLFFSPGSSEVLLTQVALSLLLNLLRHNLLVGFPAFQVRIVEDLLQLLKNDFSSEKEEINILHWHQGGGTISAVFPILLESKSDGV